MYDVGWTYTLLIGLFFAILASKALFMPNSCGLQVYEGTIEGSEGEVPVEVEIEDHKITLDLSIRPK